MGFRWMGFEGFMSNESNGCSLTLIFTTYIILKTNIADPD